MTDAAELARARALLARTAELLTAVEAEVERLRRENDAARARVLAWEATLAALVPDDAPEGALSGVAAVHAAGGARERATDSGSVYRVD